VKGVAWRAVGVLFCCAHAMFITQRRRPVLWTYVRNFVLPQTTLIGYK
jgi:hypothetical protein